MQFIAAILGDNVELAAIRVSELRIELILQHREVGNRIVRHVNRRAGDTLVVIVHSFDREIIIAWTLPSDCRTRSSSQAAAASHAGL